MRGIDYRDRDRSFRKERSVFGRRKRINFHTVPIVRELVSRISIRNDSIRREKGKVEEEGEGGKDSAQDNLDRISRGV